MKRLKIDIYSDVVCPWCFIGTRRLAAVLDELSGEVDAELHHHAYLLNPSAPPEGFNLHERLKEQYGTDPRPMFARVEQAARDAGIPLDLSVQPYTYDTTAAHTLLRHAVAHGTQAALADALFAAYFLEGRNVSDPEVLSAIASGHGFAGEEAGRIVTDETEMAITRLEAADASRRGVRGVPLFVLDGRFSLSGAHPPEVFHAAIQRAVAAAAAENAA